MPWLRALVGLLVPVVIVAVALAVLPGVRASDAVANLVAFVGAAATALIGLGLAAPAQVPVRAALSLAGVAALALGWLAYTQPSGGWVLVAVDGALLCVAWGFGASLGRKVQHASHLFPACVVAASADIVSLLSPEGPSHAVAQSARALSVLTIGFPVPGTGAVAPALGVGDLLFMAFAIAVASTHQVGFWRAVCCCAAGIAAAGFAAANWGTAVPALVPIAAAIVLGMPAIRRLRPVERRAALLSMLIAVTVVIATAVRYALSR